MPEVIINGSEGRIEGYYYHGKNPNAPIAIVLHPHPEHGGTMNNKVTYALYRSFVSRGFNTMRFNFRGVGKSEGKFSHGEGELSDAASVLDWMQTYNPNAKYCWVGGFSFGAWVGMQLLMRRPELDGFISISPPANMYDFSFLAPCPVSGLIVQGDRDTIVSKESVQELAKKLSMQKNIVVEDRIISDADHFFTNKLDLLVNAVDSYLDKALGLQPQKIEEKA
ncbi:MAG: alpha/beta hydrolase [Candidatus Nucleicultricaceae bacterium]